MKRHDAALLFLLERDPNVPHSDKNAVRDGGGVPMNLIRRAGGLSGDSATKAPRDDRLAPCLVGNVEESVTEQRIGTRADTSFTTSCLERISAR